MSQVLVIGASGTVGSTLVDQLKAAGAKVRRATSGAPQAQDQVQLDLVSGKGLDEALAGIDRMFVLSPPGFTNQDQLLSPLIERARQQKLTKVVLMSAMGANASDDLPFRKAELQLIKSGLAYNIIRPNWFMQNFNSFWLAGIQQAQKVFLPVGDARTSFIDARDIASVAGQLLLGSKFDGQEFDLTGAESLTHAEAAQHISRATGKQITFQDITPDEMYTGLLAAGLPADYSKFLIAILGFLKEGYAERQTDAVQVITGKAPRTFAEYARDYKQAWL